MHWIHNFDLFLFDFDGLLVDTENLHFRAYQELCQRRGNALPWDLNRFMQIAHADATGLRREISALFPRMIEQEIWENLYSEKKAIYESLIEQGDLSLLPGVEALLLKLASEVKKRCVVTNSTQKQTDAIRTRIRALQSIPHWFTRESYERPKPAPDGYLTALKALSAEGDRVIGFEDSMRGYHSLKEAGVGCAVLICSPGHPQLDGFAEKDGWHVSSFETVSKILG